MSYREAILKGTKAAAGLHEKLGIRTAIEQNRKGSVDLFGSILKSGASLVFRPLDGLLGACVNGRGVLISTQRTLPIQRFTAAHELGHVELRHNLSLDGEEILELPDDYNDIELEADGFAGEFLLP